MGFFDTIKNIFGMNEEDKDLETLLSEGLIEKAKGKFTHREEFVKKALEEYNIETHEINNRPDKSLLKGSIITSWNLPISYQRKIVQSARAFLYGKPVKFKQESEGTDKAFKMLLDLRKEMRMPAKDKKVAELRMSETECAKLFVPYRDSEADKSDLTKFNSLKCIILARSLGDKLYVSFDSFGVLRAVAREYKVKVGRYDIEHFDVYMADQIYYSQKDNGNWIVKSEPNLIGKIPIVYYRQEKPEWHEVQKLIVRREYLTSSRADNNDRTGDAILLLEGDVVSLPKANEAGKVIKMKPGGKASYLSPQMNVDLVKDEKEDLKELINYITDTFDHDKIINTQLTSGKALEMAFFPCILKAMDQQGDYEEYHDRENEILKVFMYKVIDTTMEAEVKKLDVSIEFGNPLPDNIEDIVTMLATAVGGKAIMSQKTAVEKNPLVLNADAEMIQLKEENIDGLEE